MKCEELQSLHGAYLDSELDARTTLEIQQHLAACPECARAFAVEGKLDARINSGLKRGQRTAALWNQIEQRIAASAAPGSNPAGRSGASAERRNRLPRNANWRRSAETPLRDLETAPAKAGFWWRELLWPSPQAWAGLAAVWLVVLAASLIARDPGMASEARNVSRPSRQTRELLQEQRQMFAELNGLSDPLAAEQTGTAAPQPRSQLRKQHSNT